LTPKYLLVSNVLSLEYHHPSEEELEEILKVNDYPQNNEAEKYFASTKVQHTIVTLLIPEEFELKRGLY